MEAAERDPLPGARADAPEPPLDGARCAASTPRSGAWSPSTRACPKALGDGRPHSAGWSALRRVLFQLYALLEIHLVEEEVYIPIINHGVSDEAAEVMAAALEHSGIPEA